MNIKHHPSDELLFDYAAGNLGEGWSLAIATHLALCPACRRTVADLEAVGGALLEAVPPTTVASSVVKDFDALMMKVFEEGSTTDKSTHADRGIHKACNIARFESTDRFAPPVLPQPLRGYLGSDIDGIQWKGLGRGASQAMVGLRGVGATARMLKIPAGKPVPEHTHRGLELTLVLRGAFEDETGVYGPGDLQQADDSLNHRPHALPGEDCICLAVTDAPLRFKGLAARLVQPLLGI